MAGRTSGGHIRGLCEADSRERLGLGWLAGWLAAPSCSNETVSRMLSALGTRLSASWRARSLTYEEGSEGAHHEADSIPSSPAPAAPSATEAAYQGGRNSGWTCQPCPIDWTVCCITRACAGAGAPKPRTVSCTHTCAPWPLRSTVLYIRTHHLGWWSACTHVPY